MWAGATCRMPARRQSGPLLDRITKGVGTICWESKARNIFPGNLQAPHHALWVWQGGYRNGGTLQNQTKTSGRDLHTGVKQARTPHLSLAGRIRTGAEQNVIWPGRALETGCLGSS